MKSLLNTLVISAISLAVVPAITQASNEGTFTSKRPVDSHFAAVSMTVEEQGTLDRDAGHAGQEEKNDKIVRHKSQKNADKNTLDPLEPDYVWWQ